MKKTTKQSTTEYGAMLIEVIVASGLVLLSGSLALQSVQRANVSTQLHLEHAKPQCSHPSCGLEESMIRCVCGNRTAIVIR